MRKGQGRFPAVRSMHVAEVGVWILCPTGDA